MMRRLPEQPGEWIDRSQRIDFRFEGRSYQGFRGDVLNSALLANGIRVVGRSFKYHRPRGVYSLANHDANGLFCAAGHVHLRGDLVPLGEGLDFKAVNTRGGVAGDWLRFTQLFSRFLPVGFYYKAFFKPRWAFPFHERMFRELAGLGAITPSAPAPNSPKDYAWCDVLVVGSGASGLAAAEAAAECGAKVLLVEEQPRIGGSLHWQREDGDPTQELADYRERLLKRDVEIRCGTLAAASYADHWVTLACDSHLTKLRAKSVVYATGAIEQPAVFQNNDVPGVMLASAAQRLIHQFAVKPFDEVVVLAANAEGYRAALDFDRAGIRVRALVDLRDGEAGELGLAVANAGISVIASHGIREVVAAKGGTGVRDVVLSPLESSGKLREGATQRIPCDGVAVAVGHAPNAALLYQAGGKFGYDTDVNQLVPDQLPEGVHAAGRVNGIFELADRRSDGRRAGFEAALAAGCAQAPPTAAPPRSGPSHSHVYPIFEHPAEKNFVDFDEDVSLADVTHGHQEGYDSVELMKRYTTLGMGPSQGKLSSMNAVRILAKLNGASIDETGTTTSRPFVQPVSLGHLAGRRFHPMRRTPIHSWHGEHAAEWVHAGSWYRPEFYRKGSETRAQRIVAEASKVRESLGLIDVGTLGKLAIAGPDAVTLLERIYTGRFASLAVGRQRYAVALDESGVVIEDGVVARTEEDRFYVSTTSGGVDGFFREMQRWALLWGLNVSLANVTGQYAAMNLAGPESRAALQAITDLDLDAEAFPYLGVREGRVAGVPVLALRVGFVGELGYELHVPASSGLHVWEALMEAGKRFDIAPFGVEAQRLLRLEKGHLIVGHDSDALSFPRELDLNWAVAKKKDFFVGKRSLAVVETQTLKRQLVGLRWPEGAVGPFPEECQLIIHDGEIAGRVTSVAPSSTLGFPLGMAFVRPDLTEPGTRVSIRLGKGLETTATVSALCHYDPENARQEL